MAGNGAGTGTCDPTSAIRAVVLADPRVRSVELTGSGAAGTATDLSDWDYRSRPPIRPGPPVGCQACWPGWTRSAGTADLARLDDNIAAGSLRLDPETVAALGRLAAAPGQMLTTMAPAHGPAVPP